MKYAEIRNGAVIGFRYFDEPVRLSDIEQGEDGLPILRPVTIVGYTNDFDPEIQQRYGPTFAISDTEVVETYQLEFRPDARQVMLRKIDEHAEARRAAYITALPGNILEYTYVYEEALNVLALPEGDPIPAGAYPLLEADVGATINPMTSAPVQDVREAAAVVKGNRDAWYQLGAAIKATRLQTKAAISAAASDADAFTIYGSVTWPA
ncbi:MAG: hypothetical protein LPL29_14585 [Alphaproteobacteria bacterium]|nr:hypothetical protein [Alphaproteobacteria bacterium]